MRLFILILVLFLQGPAFAFNPVTSVIKIPFAIAKFGVKTAGKVVYTVASAPIKLAVGGRQAKANKSTAGNIASFIIKNAPYKDLALMGL